MKSAPFNSYEQLESYLRDWRSFRDPDVYDAVGMMGLLEACLENLKTFALESECEDFANSLTDEMKAFLKQLAGCPRKS